MEQNLPFTPEQILDLTPVFVAVTLTEQLLASKNASFSDMKILVKNIAEAKMCNLASITLSMPLLMVAQVLTSLEQSSKGMKDEDKENIRQIASEEVAEILLPALYLAAGNVYKGSL